jgi:hypothetical protein
LWHLLIIRFRFWNNLQGLLILFHYYILGHTFCPVIYITLLIFFFSSPFILLRRWNFRNDWNNIVNVLNRWRLVASKRLFVLIWRNCYDYLWHFFPIDDGFFLLPITYSSFTKLDNLVKQTVDPKVQPLILFICNSIVGLLNLFESIS